MKQFLLLGLVLLPALVGCTLLPTPPPTLLPDQAYAFAAQVDATSENMLVAMNNHDGEALLRDMDEAMRKAMAGKVEQLHQDIVGKIGLYVPNSKQMVKVDEQQGYRRVFYDATFEQEAHVQVIVVYSLADDRPLVSGLWFDSPRLRQK